MSGSTVRRVLIYRLGSLGDMAIAVPVFRLVRRAFPNAEIRLLTNEPVDRRAPAAMAVLDGSGLVDGYHRYPAGTRSLFRLGKLAAELRWWSPEVTVYLTAARGVAVARRDARFFQLCGVSRVIGAPLTSAMQGNFFGAEPTSEEAHARLQAADLEPEAARLARCVHELGAADLDQPGSWSLGLTEAERARAKEALRSLGATKSTNAPVAVSLGTKVQAKDWGTDNWRALLMRLAPAMNGRDLLMLGAAEEAAASDFAAQGWQAAGGGQVLNLCGQLTPRESAAVMETCCLFLGHDSGPMHLAASVGTPVVAIFAARNIPRQWFPYGRGHQVLYHRVECWGCELETCTEQRKKCLLSISVEEVEAAVHRILGSSKESNKATLPTANHQLTSDAQRFD